MPTSTLRRLAADHAALHHSSLPPYFLFSPSADTDSDDLTQLSILLAGPPGTPYSAGLWRVHLKIPSDYPSTPPKAVFRTRIWHPNVEEATGVVCVDTLKRDWETRLTLRDILITISCLLIHPNPDSALNSSAGALLQEDYDSFARQARMMTSIHAPVPEDLHGVVMEARFRGEDVDSIRTEEESGYARPQMEKESRVQTLRMKKPAVEVQPQPQRHIAMADTQSSTSSSDEDENTASKENDPSLSPTPVRLTPRGTHLSPRKNGHGKRPLSVLSMPMETDDMEMDPHELEDMETDTEMTASEKNIAANTTTTTAVNAQQDRADPTLSSTTTTRLSLSPHRKSPKRPMLNNSVKSHQEGRENDVPIFEDTPAPIPIHQAPRSRSVSPSKNILPPPKKDHILKSDQARGSGAMNRVSKYPTGGPASRKVSSKVKPRVGIRRL